VAHDVGAPTLFRVSERFEMPLVSYYGGLAASTMILAHSPETLSHLALPPASGWRELAVPPGRAWSDDYINLPRALWESLTGVEECRIYLNVERCRGANAPASDAPAETPEAKD
jgi:hypothetical protein